MNSFSTTIQSFNANTDPGLNSIRTHYLYPAALFADRLPHLVNTILGSCVAVCLYDPTFKIGGINHFMLPLWNGQGLASPKYGNIAIEKLISKLSNYGCSTSNMIAKVFGGGEVIQTITAKSFNIGERNIELALGMLNEYNIRIVSKSVGGKFGRKIQFNSGTGEVRHKFIEKTNINN